MHYISLDELGHKAYASSDSECYKNIVSYFGSEIVKEDGSVDRKALGDIVFHDKDKMLYLEHQVNREITRMKNAALDQIPLGTCESPQIVLIEGATILKMETQYEYDEIWSCILPEKETLLRLQSVRGHSEEKARAIMAHNLTTKHFVDKAHRVFSSTGSKDDLFDQADRAMLELLNVFSTTL